MNMMMAMSDAMAADVMSGLMMAVVFVMVAVFWLAMYDPKPVPYMDGHY